MEITTLENIDPKDEKIQLKFILAIITNNLNNPNN